jgi:nuclear pore complex protein Nup133
LVSASASSSEPGLVVVVPTTGKITYWESIASAATLDLRLQRNGVELAIAGMLSGETVIRILNAESAGFVLAFSTGRLAYMSVRDGQGRPAISVQFLRGTRGPVNTGIFGSLRNALSSSAWRGDIAAVRAGRPEKVGERNVVVTTAKGKIQSWNMHRDGHNSLQTEAESRDVIVMAIKETVPALADLLLESFEILDFTHTPKSTQRSDQEENGIGLLLLTSLTDRQLSHYSLVEVVLKRDEVVVENVRPIRSYTTPINRLATSKTSLYLPNPALVAYVVFDKAVVVISMAKQPESPDSQLRAENHILPQTFEDVIDFREDMHVEIVGSGMEEPHGPSHGTEDLKLRRHKAKHPAVVLIVRGGGVVRVAATDVTKLISSKAQQVTARSKLEQAVFYGSLEQNPVSFAVRPELQFPSEEVGAAAMELSQDILRSQTPYIPSVPASIEQNLQKRSTALRSLAEHLRVTSVVLDRVTRWKLLWDAEKMEAATIIWKRYDACLRDKPTGKKRGLLTEVVECIHEDYKTEPVPEAGELDRVRHWFINDIWNLDVAVPWAYQVIKYTYQDGQKDHSSVMEMLGEADDLVMGALQGAFDFRTANVDLYGLRPEQLENGLLKVGYEGLPEFWTSTFYIVENVRKQADLAGVLVKEYWGKPEDEGLPNASLVNKIRHENPALVDLSIRSNTERLRWSSEQGSHELQIEGEEIKSRQVYSQNEQLILLATDIGLAEEAMALAEKYEILPTLVSIIMSELDESSAKLREVGLPREVFESAAARLHELHDRVGRYFAIFGASWATALYEHDIQEGLMENLLDNYQDQREFLTAFLCSKPEYAKISWIQDVTREQNYDQAARTLLDLGLKREQDVWSKKIELSMGKLARMAGRNYSQANGILIPDGGRTELAAAQNQLELIKIQDEIYDYVLPSINTAIDEKAELQIALEVHGNKSLKRKKAFLSFLEESMAHLVKHEAMDALTLIDLLTLMDGNANSEEERSFRGQQFYLALQASLYGLADKDEQALTQRVIWRRCMLRDDWAEVNNTNEKDDQQVSEQLRKTALYMTYRACFKNRMWIGTVYSGTFQLTVIGLFEKNSKVKPISPQDVLGACTDELDHRFTRLDASIRERIMKDMQDEDDAMKPYIGTCRLNKWYQGALDLAKQDFAQEINDETNDGERMRQIAQKLQEVESGIAESEREKAESLLHSKPRYKPKAKADRMGRGSFRASIKSH